LIGRPDLAEDPRFITNPLRIENRQEIVSLIAKTLRDITRDDLLKGMEDRGIPGGPINTVGEALESDQARARGMKIEMAQEYAQSGSVSLIGNPIRMSRTPVTYRFAPPKLGTDTPLAFWADAQPSKI
jgi:formyl-CoA transferase